MKVHEGLLFDYLKDAIGKVPPSELVDTMNHWKAKFVTAPKQKKKKKV